MPWAPICIYIFCICPPAHSDKQLAPCLTNVLPNKHGLLPSLPSDTHNTHTHTQIDYSRLACESKVPTKQPACWSRYPCGTHMHIHMPCHESSVDSLPPGRSAPLPALRIASHGIEEGIHALGCCRQGQAGRQEPLALPRPPMRCARVCYLQAVARSVAPDLVPAACLSAVAGYNRAKTIASYLATCD